MQKLLWIPAWAKERLKVTNYIELDASFRASKPYAYCCVNSICHNESVTIGLSIAPSESVELYEDAYLGIEKVGVDRESLNKIPVLSDLGSALSSFCEQRKILQFFCHKHILEIFGDRYLRIWCNRILSCTNEKQYFEIIPLIQEEINIWVSQFKDPSKVPQKINYILSMIDPFLCDKKYNYRRWAICNHSESLHRVINAKVGMLPVEKCECGWNLYYTQLFGIDFPCVHQIGNSKFNEYPNPPKLIIPEYKNFNSIEIYFNENCLYPEEKIENRTRIYVENEAPRENIRSQEKYARSEMWKIIYELEKFFNLSKEEAVNMVLDEYFAVKNEENLDIEAIALMRMKCYSMAS